jgi:hypothetical protein
LKTYFTKKIKRLRAQGKKRTMRERMDRSVVFFGTAEEHDKREKEYLKKDGYEEKLKTITYLRECFYGTKATTGRLQRVYRFSKRK